MKSILDGWEDLIQQAEALEVDGAGLEINFEDRQELHYALVAMVVYNSRPETASRTWGYTLNTKENTLFIHKVTLEA
jgi:hypothetical protein